MIEQFMADGYVRIDGAFSHAVAEAGRTILWRDTGCDPNDPSTWTKPSIRLGYYRQEPFARAASSPILYRAFDELVGAGRWLPVPHLGTFVIRFPSTEEPGDTGWHIDPSFGLESPDFMTWRANYVSKGRALLMLFLFSDVGVDDAPTRIRVGSHLDIAERLRPSGDAGLSLGELASTGFAESAHRPEISATGEPAPFIFAIPTWYIPGSRIAERRRDF